MRVGEPPLDNAAPLRYIPAMSIALLFWVIYIVAIVFGLYTNRAGLPAWAGGSLLYFILIGILGWAVFGAAIHR